MNQGDRKKGFHKVEEEASNTDVMSFFLPKPQQQTGHTTWNG
jgi:hypothetical protein